MIAKREKPGKTGKDKKSRKEKEKEKTKTKVIRDSFTIPENDYGLIKVLKQKCLALGIHVKKSELLRAGLHALNNMNDKNLSGLIDSIEKIKTGRPALSETSETTTGTDSGKSGVND